MDRSERHEAELQSYDAHSGLWEEEEPLSTQAALEVVRAYEVSLQHRERREEKADSPVISMADRIKQAGEKAKFTSGMPAPAPAAATLKAAGGSSSSSSSSSTGTHFPFSSSLSPLKSTNLTSTSSSNSSCSLGSAVGGGGSSDDLDLARALSGGAASPAARPPSAALNIVVLHLDLGIGGAERLMVNAAMCLQSLGHHVTVATTHHDPEHCFEETKPWVSEREHSLAQHSGNSGYPGPGPAPRRGGVLGNHIVVFGDWLPRRLPLVGATALCSVVRMLYLTSVLLLLHVWSHIPWRWGSAADLMQQDSDEDQPGSPRRGSGGDGDGDGGYYLDSSSAGSSPRSPRSAGGTAALSPPSPARGGGAGARARAGAAGAGAGPRSPYRIDAVVLDGISLPLPLFAWIGIPSIFYCHFPDKLLVQYNNNKDVMSDVNDRLKKGEKGFVLPPMGRGAHNGDKYRLRRWYRSMLDTLEEVCMGCANVIMVNSKFTEAVFRASFTLLGQDVHPLVVYPTLDPPMVKQEGSGAQANVDAIKGSGDGEVVAYLQAAVAHNQQFETQELHTRTHVYVSLNRYERKKKVELALDALHRLSELYKQERSVRGSPRGSSQAAKLGQKDRFLLVIAGGYDNAVDENIEYLLFLKSRCDQLGLRYVDERWGVSGDSSSAALPSAGPVSVVFRVSISSAERTALLAQAAALLYTPDNEHFGIVPLECMQRGTPVVAVNSGGPRETVVHKSTGFLCDQSADSFAKAMLQLAQMECTLVAEQESSSSASGGVIVRSPLSLHMGATGKHHVEQHFHSNVMRRQFLLCLQQLFPKKVFALDSEMGSKYGRAKGRSRYIGNSGARVRTSSNDEAPATFVPFDDGSLVQADKLEKAEKKEKQEAAAASLASGTFSGTAVTAVAAGAVAKQKAMSPEARYLLDSLHRTRPKKNNGDGFDTDYGNEKSNMELLMPGSTPFDNQPIAYNASYVSMVAGVKGGVGGLKNTSSAGTSSDKGSSTPAKRVYTNSSAILSSWQAQKALAPAVPVTIEFGVGINPQTSKYSMLIVKSALHWLACVCIVVVVPMAVIYYAP